PPPPAIPVVPSQPSCRNPRKTPAFAPAARHVPPVTNLLSHPRDSTINQTRHSKPPHNPLALRANQNMIISPIPEALTFDDVLLVPSYSEVVPTQVSTQTQLTK